MFAFACLILRGRMPRPRFSSFLLGTRWASSRLIHADAARVLRGAFRRFGRCLASGAVPNNCRRMQFTAYPAFWACVSEPLTISGGGVFPFLSGLECCCTSRAAAPSRARPWWTHCFAAAREPRKAARSPSAGKQFGRFLKMPCALISIADVPVGLFLCFFSSVNGLRRNPRRSPRSRVAESRASQLTFPGTAFDEAGSSLGWQRIDSRQAQHRMPLSG